MYQYFYLEKTPVKVLFGFCKRMHSMLNIEKGSIRVNDYRKSECDVEVFILLLQHNSYSSNISHTATAGL